jgi:phage gp37-like protein
VIDFEAIESKIVEVLQADTTLAAQARHIGAWEGEAVLARKAGVVIKLPAVLVVYAGGPIRRRGMADWKTEARFDVTVQAQNFRGANKARTGAASGTEVGAYDLIRSVLRILSGKTLGLEIGELTPDEVGYVPLESGETAYVVPFITTVALDFSEQELQEPEAKAVAALESIHTEHVVLRLDGDGVSVVTDVCTLPQPEPTP